jgi:hypothetical protein
VCRRLHNVRARYGPDSVALPSATPRKRCGSRASAALAAGVPPGSATGAGLRSAQRLGPLMWSDVEHLDVRVGHLARACVHMFHDPRRWLAPCSRRYHPSTPRRSDTRGSSTHCSRWTRACACARRSSQNGRWLLGHKAREVRRRASCVGGDPSLAGGITRSRGRGFALARGQALRA